VAVELQLLALAISVAQVQVVEAAVELQPQEPAALVPPAQVVMEAVAAEETPAWTRRPQGKQAAHNPRRTDHPDPKLHCNLNTFVRSCLNTYLFNLFISPPLHNWSRKLYLALAQSHILCRIFAFSLLDPERQSHRYPQWKARFPLDGRAQLS
jgi:hypothetical protein